MPRPQLCLPGCSLARPLALHRRQVIGFVAAAIAASALPGCKRPPPEPLVKAGMYQGTPEELDRLWHDILAACKADDRGRVHELMRSFLMTQPELATLLGPTQGAALWARYQQMMGSLVNAGAVELVAHVFEKKYDDIAVTRVDQLPSAEQADTDRAVLAAMSSKLPMYTVRVKRKTEAKGLRYDFFVYLNGYWRSGNLLGKFLPPVAKPTTTNESDLDNKIDGGSSPSVSPSAPPSPAQNPPQNAPAAAPRTGN